MNNIKKLVVLPIAVLAFGTLVGCNNESAPTGSDIQQYESYFKFPKGCTTINSAYAEKVYSNAIACANEAKLVTSDTVANYKPEYYKGRALYSSSSGVQKVHKIGEISYYDCDEALQYDTKTVKFYDNNYLEVSSVVGNRRTINGNVQHLVDENIDETIFYEGEEGPDGPAYPFYKHATSSKESTAVSYVSPFMNPDTPDQLGIYIRTPQEARDVMKTMMDKYSLGYISLSNALSTLMDDFTIAQEALSTSLIRSMFAEGIPHYVMDANGDIYFNYFTAVADGLIYNSGSSIFQQIYPTDYSSLAEQLSGTTIKRSELYPGTTWKEEAIAGRTDFVREGIKGYDYIPTVSTMQIAIKMSRHNGSYRIDYHAAKATQSYVCDEFGNDLAKPLNFVTCYGISNASYDSNGTHSELSTKDLYTPVYQVLGIDSYARVYRDDPDSADGFAKDDNGDYIFDVVDDPVYLDRFSTSHGQTGKNQGIELTEMKSTKIKEIEAQVYSDRSSIGGLQDITPYEWAYNPTLKDNNIYVYSGVIDAPSMISTVEEMADFKKKANADSKSGDYGVVYDYGITIGGMPSKKTVGEEWRLINPNEYPIGYNGNNRQIGELPATDSWTIPLGYENLIKNTTVSDGYVGPLLPSTYGEITEEESDDYNGKYINRYAESGEEYLHDKGFAYLDGVTPIALTPGCSYRLTVYFDKEGNIYSGEDGTGQGMVISYLGTNVNRVYVQEQLQRV